MCCILEEQPVIINQVRLNPATPVQLFLSLIIKAERVTVIENNWEVIFYSQHWMYSPVFSSLLCRLNVRICEHLSGFQWMKAEEQKLTLGTL